MLSTAKILLSVITVMAFLQANAQDSLYQKHSSNSVNAFTNDKDITDLFSFLKKKKPQKKQVKNLQIAALPVIGYSLQTGFAAVLTGNAGFSFNSKDSQQKLSTVSAGITYSQKNQVIFPLVLSIWTKANKYNIISDNRFLNYPSYIFGIGNHTEPDKIYACSFSSLVLHESLLTTIAKNTSVGMGWFYDRIWNIKGFDTIYPVINPDANAVVREEIASGICARFLYDNRLNPINPAKGFMANIIYRYNNTLFGSNENWSCITVDTRAYIPFPQSTKNVLALWSYNWLNIGANIPSFLLASNGWDDLHNVGRGYIQGRFRGKNMYALEAEYRFRLTHNGLLGATVFTNAMHFSQEYFYKQSDVKMGGGIGLRIKFNKYTSSNVSIDYAFGQNGSQGFFVNVGEVF